MFSAILRSLRSNFNNVSPRLQLSLAGAAIETLMVGYDFAVMNETVDFISIMGYDYRAWEQGYPVTGHHSALYPSQFDISYMKTLNLNWTAFHYLEKGLSKNKIVLGMPTYSIGWKLMFTHIHGVYAPAVGDADPEELFRGEICSFLKQNVTNYEWDDHAKEPYASNGRNWYSFDNEKSVTLKCNLIKQELFGGAMLFSLDADVDFNRTCGSQSDFPLHYLVTKLLQ